MRTKRLSVVATLALVAAGSLAACGGGGSGSDSKTVTIWTSMDQPVVDGLSKQVDAEAQKQGITVKWSRIDNINQLIMTKIQANDAPDIAMIPQPGVVASIVQRGAAQPLNDIVDMSALQSSMVPGTLDAGTVNGKLYGLLVSMNVKSLVFYPKVAWDKAGWKIPKSIPELESLTTEIAQKGPGAPWCYGIGSDAATGWPATDWIEELVMKYGGVDQYNQWVSHQIPFSSDIVKQAGNELAKLMFPDGNTPGGQDAIASTNFADADDPMWDTPPGCWMLKQGNFITAFFPADVQKNLNTDVGVFGFPPATVGGDNPVLGGGDLATLLSTSSSAKEVMKLLSADNLGTEAAPTSSYLSPHKNFDQSLYPNNVQKTAAQVAYGATAFLFDGSDAMPAEVGAGSFWKEMTAWTSGSESLDQALKNIDDSWPAS
jgi:ABC-type glycerol-3-phosphate transport system substrate-binding protein